MPELVFVLSPHANLFWVEIAEVTCDELTALGVKARTTTEGFPPAEPGLVYVLAPPHEYFALEVVRTARPPPPPDVLKRTIFICGEQAGTSHFEENVALVPQGGALFDLNRGSIREFARRGIQAQTFQLGHTARWDHRPDSEERDVDVLFLGSQSPRRDRLFAQYAESLWRWHCRLVFGDNSGPNHSPSARYLAEEAKWQALTHSKIMLNVHAGDIPYFEWQRVIAALANGCALVTEHSTDFAPLVPGEHFLCAQAHNLAFVAEHLLEDDEARRELAAGAHAFIRDELPLRRAAEALATAADEVDRNPVPSASGGFRRSFRRPAASGLSDGAREGPDNATIGVAVAEMVAAMRDLSDAVERASSPRATELGSPIEIAATSRAYRARHPRVCVITLVSNDHEQVEATLSSAVAGRYRDVGLIVVDDGSTDGSLEGVRSWLERHHSFPAIVLRHPHSRGLTRSVNEALSLGIGEFTLLLRAGNTLFPHALGRLVAALDWDSDAAFAYGLTQLRRKGGPAAIGNVYPWEPARLRAGPYIDEIALVRTAVLREHGGFTLDRRLDGWQEHDLWCGLAERELHGAFVPEILARRRNPSPGVADLVPAQAYEALGERYPALMAGRARGQ